MLIVPVLDSKYSLKFHDALCKFYRICVVSAIIVLTNSIIALLRFWQVPLMCLPAFQISDELMHYHCSA